MPQPTRPALHHVALTVNDVEASIPWYENLFGIKPYFLGVGPHVRAAEQSTRPARHVVALEPFEQGHTDFRFFGNRYQRHPLLFTLRAKPGSEGLFHARSHPDT